MLDKTSSIPSCEKIDRSDILVDSKHSVGQEVDCLAQKMPVSLKASPISNEVMNFITTTINGGLSPVSTLDTEFGGEGQDANKPLQRHGKAPILILLGTSTSGKTTLIDPIKAANPRLKDHSGDILFDRTLAELIKIHFSKEYALLCPIVGHEKILSVCRGDVVNGKFEASHQSQISLAAQTLIDVWSKAVESPPEFDEARSRLQKSFWEANHEKLIADSLGGFPVILDSVNIPDLQSLFESFPANNFIANMHLMIIFCPLRELSERLTLRNADAENTQQPSNKRVGFPIKQFSELYKPRLSKEEPLLQVLTRKDCMDAFRVHVDPTIHTEEKFLNDLGFTSGEIDEVEITTRASFFHSIFNTVTYELFINSK